MPPRPSIEEKPNFARVAVASALDSAAAVGAALATLGVGDGIAPGTVVLLPPPPVPAAVRAAVRALAGPHPETARPQGGPTMLATGTSGWRAVSLPVGARRFDRVSVPARLLDRPLVLVSPWPTERRAPTPLESLAAFAHPRQRLAARIGGDPGATAELASPWRPDLVLLAGEFDGRAVVALTSDLIAAELVARALQPAPPDAPGPWEHAAVQRATELDLGARTPAAIQIVAADAHAESLARTIRPRIGLG